MSLRKKSQLIEHSNLSQYCRQASNSPISRPVSPMVARDYQGNIGPLTKVIPLNLFLDIVHSFFADITCALRGCFRGGSDYVSFCFVSKQRKTFNGCFFDILITSKGPSSLGMFRNLIRSLNKCLMSPPQTITTERTAEKLVGKRVKIKQTPKHKLTATEQTDCRKCWKTLSPSCKTSLSSNGKNAKGNID